MRKFDPDLNELIQDVSLPDSAKKYCADRGLEYLGELTYFAKWFSKRRFTGCAELTRLVSVLLADPLTAGWAPKYWGREFDALLDTPAADLFPRIEGEIASRGVMFHELHQHHLGSILRRAWQNGQLLNINRHFALARRLRPEVRAGLLVPAGWRPTERVPKEWTRIIEPRIKEMRPLMLAGLRGDIKAGHQFIDHLNLALETSNQLHRRGTSLLELVQAQSPARLGISKRSWQNLVDELAAHNLHFNMTGTDIELVLDQLDPAN